MKHNKLALILAGVLIALLMIPSIAGVTWLTYREDVSFTGASSTLDIREVRYYNGTTSTTYRNLSLPCNVSELSGSHTYINISATQTGNISYNLTVNGNILNASSVLNNTAPIVTRYFIWNLETLRKRGHVTNTSPYINFTFDCNNSENLININVTGTDVNVTPAWLSRCVVVTEYDRIEPEIRTSLSSSFFTVNNSINITNTIENGLWMSHNISDVNLTTVYPAHAINSPDTYIKPSGTMANGSSMINYTTYQKRGPYTYSIDEDVNGSEHEVTILVKCEEVLTNCVDWTIDPDDDFYEGYFDTVDNSTLEITLNGVEKDWDRDGNDIEQADLTIRASQTLNKFEFTWTVPAVAEPAAAPIDLSTEVLFLPLWLWIAIIVVAVIIVCAVAYIKYT